MPVDVFLYPVASEDDDVYLREPGAPSGVDGDGAVVEAADASAASAMVQIIASAATTESADVSTGDGTVVGDSIQAEAEMFDDADISAGVGVVPIQYTFPWGGTFFILPGLDVARLVEGLSRRMDPEHPDFEGFPADDVEAVATWVDAMDAYTLGGLGIIPPSAAGPAASAALAAGLVGMSLPNGFLTLGNAAFAAYATALAGGMIQGAVTVATPPPLAVLIPLIATTFPAGMAGASCATQVAAIAAAIDEWMRTGVSSTGGPTSPWS